VKGDQEYWKKSRSIGWIGRRIPAGSGDQGGIVREGLGWSGGGGKRVELRGVGDKVASHRTKTSAVDRIYTGTVDKIVKLKCTRRRNSGSSE